jgi:hypothetical protein
VELGIDGLGIQKQIASGAVYAGEV